MKKLSKKEIDKLVEKAVRFTKSAEGKRKIKEAFEQAGKASKAFAEACYIHPNDPRLFEPMTI
ncbi:MAG: hypothetical protein ACE5F2_00330 [Candidatus Paceibacteria bacterium]